MKQSIQMPMSALVGVVALGLSLQLTGCAADDMGDDEVGVTQEALSTYSPVSFSMPDAYYGTTSSGTTCSSSAKMDMAGYEPSEGGTYPVAIWVTGTGGDWNAALAQSLT